MKKSELKKIIATAIATGVVVTGASLGIDRARCDYVIVHEKEGIYEELCVSTELHDAIKSQLKPNSGFGGVNFGGD